MKATLRKIFKPILSLFEVESSQYTYQKSHRKILMAVAVLFLFLSFAALFAVIKSAIYGGLIPCIIFFSIGFVCAIVAAIGTDQAVANIWKSK